jgi:hypothetical protein
LEDALAERRQHTGSILGRRRGERLYEIHDDQRRNR